MEIDNLVENENSILVSYYKEEESEHLSGISIAKANLEKYAEDNNWLESLSDTCVNGEHVQTFFTCEFEDIQGGDLNNLVIEYLTYKSTLRNGESIN